MYVQCTYYVRCALLSATIRMHKLLWFILIGLLYRIYLLHTAQTKAIFFNFSLSAFWQLDHDSECVPCLRLHDCVCGYEWMLNQGETIEIEHLHSMIQLLRTASQQTSPSLTVAHNKFKFSQGYLFIEDAALLWIVFSIRNQRTHRRTAIDQTIDREILANVH